MGSRMSKAHNLIKWGDQSLCVNEVLKLQFKTRGHILCIVAAVFRADVSLLLLIISDFFRDWSFFNTDFISGYILCVCVCVCVLSIH